MNDSPQATTQHRMLQDKLAGIGQISAGIAHEINNPLGFVSSNIETARVYINEYKAMISAYKKVFKTIENKSIEDIESEIKELKLLEKKKDINFISEDLELMFDDIEEGLGRITEIVSSLKAFTRNDSNNGFEEFDLNKSIKNALLITMNDIKYTAKVIESLNEIPSIQANGNRINQVLLNIILNASAAIKERQALEEQQEEGIITITTDVKDRYVSCVVEDNGIGIEKDNISKIFDPFYTTKPAGVGTGLGLSIVSEIIVTGHKGKLFVESKPMLGTKITILLPIEQESTSGDNKNE